MNGFFLLIAALWQGPSPRLTIRRSVGASGSDQKTRADRFMCIPKNLSALVADVTESRRDQCRDPGRRSGDASIASSSAFSTRSPKRNTARKNENCQLLPHQSGSHPSNVDTTRFSPTFDPTVNPLRSRRYSASLFGRIGNKGPAQTHQACKRQVVCANRDTDFQNTNGPNNPNGKRQPPILRWRTYQVTMTDPNRKRHDAESTMG